MEATHPTTRRPIHVTARSLFFLSALFIVYATSIPWDFVFPPTLRRVQWVPLWNRWEGRLHSIPDMAQNVVLFLPFGFFGWLSIDRVRRAGPIQGPIQMALLGMLLSATVEVLQTMSLTRIPSASDVVTNTFGALAGASAAAIYAARFQDRVEATLTEIARAQPGLLIFLGYLIAVAAGSLAPFIPTLDVGALRASVRALIDHPWGLKPAGGLATDALLYSALGFLAARELPALFERRGWRPFSRGGAGGSKAGLFAAACVASLAFLLEAGQLFIIGHSPGLQDAVAGAIAGSSGALFAVAWSKGRPRPAAELGALTRSAPLLVLGFGILAPAFRALEPFALAPLHEKLDAISVWNVIPFWALFQKVNLSTLRNVFEAAMYYVPLGYALHALGKHQPVAIAAAFILADVLEVLQIPIEGRTFDLTEGVYAAAGALVGALALDRLSARQAAREPVKVAA